MLAHQTVAIGESQGTHSVLGRLQGQVHDWTSRCIECDVRLGDCANVVKP